MYKLQYSKGITLPYVLVSKSYDFLFRKAIVGVAVVCLNLVSARVAILVHSI